MSLDLHHECIRVPVTALSSCGPLLVAAEGPCLRFYRSHDFGFITSRRIFKAQAIHGVAVYDEKAHRVILAVWGGHHVRFLILSTDALKLDREDDFIGSLQLSATTKSPDWILDLSFAPSNLLEKTVYDTVVCGAVTAHNALLELTLERSDELNAESQRSQNVVFSVSLKELTSSSRSILYAAHLLWDSSNRILVAAGTAFGEIMFWSWTRSTDGDSSSYIHRVFLGHEGSIFGVCISKELVMGPNGESKRLLASCSDDRTIRIWDVTDLEVTDNPDVDSKSQRTRHTGFSNVSYDADYTRSGCIATGWGHMSRVWAVYFLEPRISGSIASLLSSGEDATSRIWHLVLTSEKLQSGHMAASFELQQQSSTAYHNGKNIWSTTLCDSSLAHQYIICGGADGRITARLLAPSLQNEDPVVEYTVQDLASIGPSSTIMRKTEPPVLPYKFSKQAEYFRSYAFLDRSSFLLTTNSGKVYLESLGAAPNETSDSFISNSVLIEELQDLLGYSICVAESSLGVAFVAGARGSIYMFQKSVNRLVKVHTIEGKVGSMFVAKTLDTPAADNLVLLVTLMGRKTAQLLFVKVSETQESVIDREVEAPISELETGLVITSMAYVEGTADTNHMFLGFRGGSIAMYQIGSVTTSTEANLLHIIDKVHSKEAVTAMLWSPNTPQFTSGHLLSVGRDSHIAIHSIDLTTISATLVHNLLLPIGPNIESLYYHNNRLHVYGFSSTKFILYDTTAEEEVLSVETGGSHRSWAFQPHTSASGGGTLVWTRASSMHVYTQQGPNHTVIRLGGHGREIKAVAVSPLLQSNPSRQLIATGAEDTDIKICEYVDGDFVCRRTLRKHTTGIQHLQWSEDGAYLFSSGGCEEFYIWRVRLLQDSLGLGVVCEAVCVPESEHSDLRIMGFDVRRNEGDDEGYNIAMVFSDSNVRVYTYNPTSPISKWHTLAHGPYFTSCLTQCVFLSPNTLLTAGTDGHAVFWPLPVPSTSHHPHSITSAATLTWQHPLRIHQNTSKTLASHTLDNGAIFLVSGGDDGSLAFLLTRAEKYSGGGAYTYPPVIVTRACTSAITACAILSLEEKLYVITCGNDQWIRVWGVTLAHLDEDMGMGEGKEEEEEGDRIGVKRLTKIKTNVADVSSMAILYTNDTAARVLICGVGMEVVRVSWC